MVKGSGIQRSFRNLEKRKFREENGLCIICAKKNDSSTKTCLKCREYVTLKRKMYYLKAKQS